MTFSLILTMTVVAADGRDLSHMPPNIRADIEKRTTVVVSAQIAVIPGFDSQAAAVRAGRAWADDLCLVHAAPNLRATWTIVAHPD